MDACERARDLILGAEAGALQPGEREELAAHLASCASCRSAAEGLESDLAALRRVGEARIEPGPERRAAFLEALSRAPEARPSRRDSRRRARVRGSAPPIRYVLATLAAAAMVVLYLAVATGDGRDGEVAKRTATRPADVRTSPREPGDAARPQVPVEEAPAEAAVDRPSPQVQPPAAAPAEARVATVETEPAPRTEAEEPSAAEPTQPPAIATIASADNEKQLRASLRCAINEAIAAGSTEAVSLTVGGASVRGRITSADERGVRLLASRGGFEAVVPWERLEAPKMLELARTYMARSSLDERLALVRFCVDRGLLRQGRQELDRLASRDPDAATAPPLLAMAKLLDDAEARREEQTAKAVAATRDPVLARPRIALASAWRGARSLGSRAYAPATTPRTGYFTDTLSDPQTGDEIIKYAAVVPQLVSTKRDLGLVVTFHGSGGGGGNENGMLWLTPIAMHDVEKGRFIVIGGRAKRGRWSRDDDARVAALVDHFVKAYPVDPRRIIFLGYSSGANMVKRIGPEPGGAAAGIVAIAGSASRRGAPTAFRTPAREADAPPVYLVHGDGDKEADVGAARDEAVRLRRQGYRSLLREMRGLDHGTILGSEDMRPVWHDLGLWMNAVRKSGQLFDEDRAFLERALETPPEALWRDGDAIGHMRRIGGAEAGALAIRAMSSEAPVVRALGASVCGTVDMGPDVVDRLIALLADPEDVVSTASHHALSRLARRGSTAARDALEALARHSRADARTRLAAVESIARVLEVQARGRIQDVRLLRDLAVLLGDADESVRDTASAALRKLVPEGPATEALVAAGEGARARALWIEWIDRELGAPRP